MRVINLAWFAILLGIITFPISFFLLKQSLLRSLLYAFMVPIVLYLGFHAIFKLLSWRRG
jgi:hypothetical protein